ncbi:MAG: hypothetical protein FP831_14300 [Anaerolineae bacterium]|nr:hypothetical protein [Anaerolineae bacterium]
MLAMTVVESWGSLRIDDGNGELISGLHQVVSVERWCGNARDDRAGGWGSLRIDDGNDELISGLRQVVSVESMCGNARDDRDEELGDRFALTMGMAI